MNSPKILIVDDEQDTRQTLNHYLSSRMECEIVEASNGYEAIEQLKRIPFDLMLLDISMPGIRGTEVIRESRKLSAPTSIIVITKWDSSEIADEVKNLGADYIPKPLSLKIVRSKVEEQLRLKNKLIPRPAPP